MLTPKQFAAFTPKRRVEIRPSYTYIPRNGHGIRSGYYRDVDIASLLREYRGKARTILYIARNVGQE